MADVAKPEKKNDEKPESKDGEKKKEEAKTEEELVNKYLMFKSVDVLDLDLSRIPNNVYI